MEIADLLIYFGAQYAINMDGGSSSVMVNMSQTILNQPSCYYNAIIPRQWMSCERSVSTVICIS
jgi:exopolysaccharide biosynthesis protein